MYKYKLSFEAEEDIIRIFEYGTDMFGIAQAKKYYDILFDCFHKISLNPFMFPVDTKHKDIDRYCVCGTDTIYFNIKTEEIIIITIIGKQDF
jgi:toxin ParE1/3/4